MKALLQPLFSKPILKATPLDPGYENHGSDVWLVETEDERAVVRSSRMHGPAEALNDFWWGCRRLFGIEPWHTFDLEAIHRELGEAGGFRIPGVLRKGVVDGREWVAVEWVDGEPLRSFAALCDDALVRFGRELALVHARAYDFCGHVTRRIAYPPGEFHERAAQASRELVDRFFREDTAIRQALDEMCQALRSLPAPGAASLILVDMDPTQFLVSDGGDIALIDAEACALGPRELDFVALEYCLDAKEAAHVAKGYASVLPVPDLTRVREPYRYVYRLLSIQGTVPLEQWLGHPALF